MHLGSLDGGTLGGSSGEVISSTGGGEVMRFGFGISLGGGGDIFSVLLHNVILLLLLLGNATFYCRNFDFIVNK